MAYIKNADVTLADVQRVLARVLLEYRDITGTHEGYVFLVECVTGLSLGEIVGFRAFADARRWILHERKSRDAFQSFFTRG